MVVTQISDFSKNRSKIYIDYEFAFVLYKGELHLYHIKEGKELMDTDYQIILKEVLPKRAKLRCLNLLKNRDYTQKQIVDKLKKGGYPDCTVDVAIEYLKSFGYIDDIKYASDYISFHANLYSSQKIMYKLLQKGISKNCIEEAFSMWREEGNQQNEKEMIQKFLEKKNWENCKKDKKEQQRMIACLYRKGFQIDHIRSVLESMDNN